jgi:ABC-type Fe3+-hydroxamate transport system substrate-binding protein
MALLSIGLLAGDPQVEADTGPPPARRVVSMNPSLTSILVALGASSTLVGIEEHAADLHPELASVPIVGGLYNPSLESVVALEPDLVVLVPSAEQRDFRGRLEALGIDVLVLPNISVEEILTSIEVLGARVGRVAEARARVEEIRRTFVRVRAAAEGRPPVRAVVVLQRDPLFVVGRGSFIDEMLRAAGVDNVARDLPDPYPRAAVEWLIAAAPEVILDAADEPPPAAVFWARWPSIPAVANGDAFALPASATYPGPYIDRSLRLIEARVAGREATAPQRRAGGRVP